MDDRGRVREALARLVKTGAYPGPDRERTLHRLLDLCGSDARPLAERALEHAQTVHFALGRTFGPWPNRLAQAVQQLAPTRLGEADRVWLVESWAYARGIIAAHELRRATVRAAPPTPLPVPRRVRPSAGRVSLAPPPAPWRSGTPISQLPRWTSTDKWGGALFGLMFLVVTVAAWRGIGRAREDGALAPVVPASEVIVRAAARRDSVQRASAERAGLGAAEGAAEGAVPSVGDTVRLADLFPRAQRDAPPPRDARDPRFAPPLVIRGIGGQYLVWRALVSVGGERGCEQVAQSVQWREPIDEAVAHQPGYAGFTFASVPGAVARLAWDGSFTLDPIRNERSGTLRLEMRGRFTDEGFEALSETTVRVQLPWRVVRVCRIVTMQRGVRR